MDLDDAAYIPTARALELYNRDGLMKIDVAYDEGVPAEQVVAAIKNLPEREQYVMSMYYEQDMNLKEIAAVLGVTESRVCQIHTKAVLHLRSRFSSMDRIPG